MNSESVDLIATDPPFNKSKDFHATPDSLAAGAKFQDRWSWERDVHQEWVDQITDDHPKLMEAIESARYAHSDGMGAFMCFMAVRLLAMRRVLKPTGSIYLHCDPTASHYLKAVMDAIFGWRNFRNEVIWQKIRSSKAQTKGFLLIHEAQQGCRDATYEPSRFPVAVPYPSPHRATPAYVVVTSSDLDTSRNKASVSGLSWISRKGFGSVHDTILSYGKTTTPTWNNIYTPLSEARVAHHYGKVEQDTGRRYGLYDFTQAGQGTPRRFGDKIIAPPNGKHWIWYHTSEPMKSPS